MSLRRIVTGVDADGRSTVVNEGAPPGGFRIESTGGMSVQTLWDVPLPPKDPFAGDDPELPVRFLPPEGALRMLRFVVPPDSARSDDVQAIVDEIRQTVPDLLSTYDPARGRGMHRTDSVDVVMVVAGRPVLVLETGQVELGPGDWVVQQGTWHAWHNPGDEPAELVGVLVRCG